MRDLNKIKSTVLPFARAQVSAFLGGIVDFLVMVFMTELVGCHYVFSIVLGGIVGAFVNFWINRTWTFGARTSFAKQVPRFISVVLGSISLKSLGTYLFVTLFSIDYKIARLLVDAFVSFGFNYTLQKYWVFKS